jgi:hypothetical protein
MLDLSPMKGIRVDPVRRTAQAQEQGGARPVLGFPEEGVYLGGAEGLAA